MVMEGRADMLAPGAGGIACRRAANLRWLRLMELPRKIISVPGQGFSGVGGSECVRSVYRHKMSDLSLQRYNRFSVEFIRDSRDWRFRC
jgi:hypothetical protein